jgi:pimeloyl-ACP methyl ester carboxylesterase
MHFQTRSLRGVLLILLAVLTSGVVLLVQPPHLPTSTHATPGRSNAYKPSSCSKFRLNFPTYLKSQSVFALNAPSAREGRDYECGYLQVPERHQQPTGKQIKLGVAMIKSNTPQPAADPLVLLQGGPGGSGIAIFSSLAEPSFKGSKQLRADRDLIILEQRGTLFSQPFLRCSEFDRAIQQQLDNPTMRPVEAKKLEFQSLQACRQRLSQDGVDLSAYNSIENAADIAALAKALGYRQINLYGVSYGTLLALHTLRQHSTLLRSVILDAVVPTQVSWVRTAIKSADRAIVELTKACTADPNCRAAYPDLRHELSRLIHRLNQQPVMMGFYDYSTLKFEKTQLTGDLLTVLVTQMFYRTDALPVIPAMIYQVRDGRYHVGSQILALQLLDRTLAEGMFYSVACGENTKLMPADVAGLDPKTAKRAVSDVQEFAKACALWNVPELAPALKQPVTSAVPTLIFNGQFDPITPPSFGEQAAKTLSRSHVITFLRNGHGAMLDSVCGSRIAAAFLNNPLQAPNSSCARQQSKLTFITPKTTFMTPGATRLMQLFSNQEFGELGIQALLLLIMGSFLFIWPLSWLLRLLFQFPSERRSLARLASWLGVLAGCLGAAWVILQIYGFAATAFADVQISSFEVFVGVNRKFAWIFVTPLLIAAAALGMLACAVVAWRKQYWGVLWRIYYTLIALAAGVYTGVLARTGQLSVLFS